MFDHPLRRGLVALCLAAFVGGTAQAQDEGIALELEAAQALSATRQPLLDAQSAAVQAAREGAVAASQLPGPSSPAASATCRSKVEIAIR